jgi:hypothetical protein
MCGIGRLARCGRTWGMMQKLHRSWQPSCTFTYARCRRPKPLMPVGMSVTPNRPSKSGSSRLSVTTSVTFGRLATSSGARVA